MNIFNCSAVTPTGDIFGSLCRALPFLLLLRLPLIFLTKTNTKTGCPLLTSSSKKDTKMCRVTPFFNLLTKKAFKDGYFSFNSLPRKRNEDGSVCTLPWEPPSVTHFVRSAAFYWRQIQRCYILQRPPIEVISF